MAAMRLIIEIPMDTYLLCVTRCGIKSPEYLMLKNGIVVSDAAGNEIVRILCNHERAKLILEKIAEFCPENLARVGQRPWEPAAE